MKKVVFKNFAKFTEKNNTSFTEHLWAALSALHNLRFDKVLCRIV